jgi:hypothetical protein
MIFRFRHRLQGAHVGIAVFAAKAADLTFEKLGDLTLRADEWRHFRALLVRGGGGDERPDGAIDVEATD